MPSRRPQPEPIGPIAAVIPDAVSPVRGQVSDRAYKRRYVPKSYSAADVEIAKRIVKHWNATFKGVSGGKRANPGDAVNIRTIVRMLKRMAKHDDPEWRFDEAQICRAITAYRNDPASDKLGRWRPLRDWMNEENIAFQLERIRPAEPRPQPMRDAAVERRTAAGRIIRGPIVQACMKVADRGISLRTWAAQASRMTTPARRITAALDRRNALDRAARETLSNRARRCFEAWFERGPRHPKDEWCLDGIELALLDIEGGTGVPPVNKGGR